MRPCKRKKSVKSNPYSLKLTPEMRQALEEFCERNEMMVAQAIRLAVRRLLAQPPVMNDER